MREEVRQLMPLKANGENKRLTIYKYHICPLSLSTFAPLSLSAEHTKRCCIRVSKSSSMTKVMSYSNYSSSQTSIVQFLSAHSRYSLNVFDLLHSHFAPRVIEWCVCELHSVRIYVYPCPVGWLDEESMEKTLDLVDDPDIKTRMLEKVYSMCSCCTLIALLAYMYPCVLTLACHLCVDQFLCIYIYTRKVLVIYIFR